MARNICQHMTDHKVVIDEKPLILDGRNLYESELCPQ